MTSMHREGEIRRFFEDHLFRYLKMFVSQGLNQSPDALFLKVNFMITKGFRAGMNRRRF